MATTHSQAMRLRGRQLRFHECQWWTDVAVAEMDDCRRRRLQHGDRVTLEAGICFRCPPQQRLRRQPVSSAVTEQIDRQAGYAMIDAVLSSAVPTARGRPPSSGATSRTISSRRIRRDCRCRAELPFRRDLRCSGRLRPGSDGRRSPHRRDPIHLSVLMWVRGCARAVRVPDNLERKPWPSICRRRSRCVAREWRNSSMRWRSSWRFSRRMPAGNSREEYIQTSGRLNTVIDLWELEDYSHYERGMGVLRGHPQFPGIAAALGETINYETVVFAVKAPYMR